jgi:hypothetical protein
MSRSPARKVAARKARDAGRKVAAKVGAGKDRATHRKTAPKVAAEQARDAYRRSAAQFEELRALVPDSMHALAQRNIAQTRELYERSNDALQAVLASWQKSFGAAGQGAVALNRKIMNIAERNINSGFDLATRLAGAKNLAEAMELQGAYWRKQLDEMRKQAEEVRVLSSKAAANVVEPIKAQVRRPTN